jgi:hypothetical protein
MRLYLDEDSIDPLLLRLLRKAKHDVQVPAALNLAGSPDPVHLKHAIREGRVLLSGNHDDYLCLHELIIEAKGHHPASSWSVVIMIPRAILSLRALCARLPSCFPPTSQSTMNSIF